MPTLMMLSSKYFCWSGWACRRVDLQDGGLGLLNLEAVEAEGHLYTENGNKHM